MAIKTLYDLFYAAGQTSAITADYAANSFLVLPQNVMDEELSKNDVVRSGEDGSEERLEIGGAKPVVFVNLQWSNVSAEDVGTILDFWADPAKGRGQLRTFLWPHPDPNDSHTYVVRFSSNVTRSLSAMNHYGTGSIKLRVLGWAS